MYVERNVLNSTCFVYCVVQNNLFRYDR